MPIYEYQCENATCAVKIERLQKVNEEPIRICPACNGESLRKLVSAAGFRLKGGGWYETDFKSDKDKKKNLSSNESTAATTIGKETSAASKSETVASADKSGSSATTSSTNSSSDAAK